jgi:hypothetical protein
MPDKIVVFPSLNQKGIQGWCIRHMIVKMKLKVKFWKWTLLFGALGLLVPMVTCIHCFLLGGHVSELEFMLWPSSIMFLALDSPTPAPTSTVVAVYAIALVENVVLYAIVGAFAWLLVNLMFCLRGLLVSRAKSL